MSAASAAKAKKSKKNSNADAGHPAEAAHPASAEASGLNMAAPWSMGVVGPVEIVKELNAPPIVQMKDMPVGAVIDCTILKAIPSTRDDIKSPLVVVKLTHDGSKVCIPGQAVIASTLLPEYDKDEAEHRDNPDALLEHRGERVLIRRTGTKESPKWKGDDGKARKYPVYSIDVVKPAKE